jgi:hypothetical protein
MRYVLSKVRSWEVLSALLVLVIRLVRLVHEVHVVLCQLLVSRLLLQSRVVLVPGPCCAIRARVRVSRLRAFRGPACARPRSVATLVRLCGVVLLVAGGALCIPRRKGTLCMQPLKSHTSQQRDGLWSRNCSWHPSRTS